MPGRSDRGGAKPATPPSGRNWTDLRARLASACVLVPVAALAVWVGGIAYAALVLFSMAGMAFEWARLFGVAAWSWRCVVFVAWPLAVATAALAGHWDGAALVVAAALVFGPALWVGQLVVGLGGLSLLWLRYMAEPGAMAVLFAVTCVVFSDTGAYMVGRIFGGPKLAPRISPAKTWSGSLGGLAFAMAAGAGLAVTGDGHAVYGLVYGGLLAVSAQAGDLAESALKRQRGVKDSGTLIPGHGGLLDRFDGLLLAAPVAALLAMGAAMGAFWRVDLASVIAGLVAFPWGHPGHGPLL